MRIALESHELLISKMTGVGRYVFELGCHLRRIEPDTKHVLPLSRIGKHARLIRNGVSNTRYIPQRWWPCAPYDILHLTAGKRMRVPGAPAIILTVHDLWEFVEFARGDRTEYTNANRRLIELLSIADGTICVSQSTQDDLRRFMPDLAIPSTVVHHGVSELFHRSEASAIELFRSRRLPHVGEYLLAVGHFHPRKNIPGLIAGYAAVARPRPPLVLAGNSDVDLRAAMQRHARALGVSDGELIQLDYVANADLSALISGARGVIFVPLYEGFGLPLIEAYRCGTPVVCADNSSLKELAHLSLPLVDATNPGSVAHGIQAMLGLPLDDRLRDTLIAHGHSFTWDCCAQKTHDFYREVLHLRHPTAR